MDREMKTEARKLAQQVLKRRAVFMRDVTLPVHKIRKVLNQNSCGCLWTRESTKTDMAEAYAMSIPEFLVDMAPCTIHESTFLELVAESRAARK